MSETETGFEMGDDESTGSYALDKAICDPFSYALQLRTGVVFRFESAERRGMEWITLHEAYIVDPDINSIFGEITRREPRKFDRDVDVRLSDIVWAADCPEGS